MRMTYVATVQILIEPGTLKSEAEAMEWMSGLLSENPEVLDWGYLRVAGQYLYPTERLVSNDYAEGDFLE